MNEQTMSRSDAEWVDWAREHRVAYEIAPLLEMRRGEKLQSGFTLSFYAAAPMETAAGRERQVAGRRLREELVALATAVAPAADRTARVELEPPRTAVLRPENEFKPEVALTWRILLSGDAPVTAEDRDRLSLVEKRLAALGCKRGRW
jgi:hypothetical protein